VALDTYRKKRDFRATPEPRGEAGGRKATAPGRSFVVQKHDARRLHYDFRLELDGVLKSWAVAKGPSLVPGERRLAVEVEDHPLEYGDFEGTIPQGEYGGGTVIVWDRGTWQPIGDAHRGLAKGHLDFELLGEKLRGRWHLVRMARKPRDRRDNWLLIKGDDDAARRDGPDILDASPNSVKTGRGIDDVAGEAPGWSSRTGKIDKPDAGKTAPAVVKGARKAGLPDFVAPELATLTAKPPAGKAWLHEIKFDGYRLQARIENGTVSLLTRGGLDWTRKFGRAIAEALRSLPARSALIDGEVVVEAASGASDFSALQADLSEGRTDRLIFYAFDLLYLDGADLRGARLVDRKAALEALLTGAPPVLRFSAHFLQDGDLIRRHACRLGLEGIVSKRQDAPYRSGRGKDWRKSKCQARQEFVIAGFVPSSVSDKAIGSLVLGYFDDGRLVHVGRVGTGFTAPMAAALYRRLAPLRIKASPFAAPLSADAARQVRYVAPDLVAEVEFRGWTADRNLRHAAFRGLREDKPAEQVVWEEPMDAPETAPKPRVALTHPDRLYWPEAGITKQGLADYYADVWRCIAPFIVGRPLALLRCPDGVGGQCFFQKHAWKGLNPYIHPRPDPAEDEPILTIDDLDGLIALVQSGVLEIHPWGSTLAALEQPDMLIFDLDPGEDVPWPRLPEAALEVRDRLLQAGLASFVKSSGGKGLHVVAPLRPEADWEAAKRFCKAIADAMAADSPERFVSTITKAKRRGRILVDYLRNARGATAVAPYSTRARAGAPVSMPVAWDDLATLTAANTFTVSNAPAFLAHRADDPWGSFRQAEAPLPADAARKGATRKGPAGSRRRAAR
jgi:bifunctional non-homologous end joining protein LigD